MAWTSSVAVYLVSIAILCFSHLYHAGITTEVITFAKANYWWPSLVVIPETEVKVTELMFSVSSAMGAFLALLFLPPVMLIVVMQSQNFIVGKTLN